MPQPSNQWTEKEKVGIGFQTAKTIERIKPLALQQLF